MKKICVVMPSYLGEYKGCASNREQKFKRAVDSYMAQDYPNKALVIVSDGCAETIRLFQELDTLTTSNEIYLVKLDKQPFLSGVVRMEGVNVAVNELGADLITYLDTDDYLLAGHLTRIVRYMERWKQYQWIWYNDRIKLGNRIRKVSLQESCIGTSNIAHRSSVPVIWGDGYGHDWTAISSMLNYANRKVNLNSYVVCHIPNQMDL